jgi:hypothetical protein
MIIDRLMFAGLLCDRSNHLTVISPDINDDYDRGLLPVLSMFGPRGIFLSDFDLLNYASFVPLLILPRNLVPLLEFALVANCPSRYRFVLGWLTPVCAAGSFFCACAGYAAGPKYDTPCGTNIIMQIN